jgi:hypothetical protein
MNCVPGAKRIAFSLNEEKEEMSLPVLEWMKYLTVKGSEG